MPYEYQAGAFPEFNATIQKGKPSLNNKRSFLQFLSVLGLALFLAALAACAPANAPAGLRPVPVADAQIQVGVGSPIPVDVFASGQPEPGRAPVRSAGQRARAGAGRRSARQRLV